MTPEDRAAYEEERLEEAGDAGRDAEADMLAAIEYPQYKAPYTGLLADDDGRLWIRESAGPNNLSSAWIVFGPDGKRVGRVTLPRVFALRAVLDNTAFGVQEEEQGFQSVQAYAIEPSGL